MSEKSVEGEIKKLEEKGVHCKIEGNRIVCEATMEVKVTEAFYPDDLDADEVYRTLKRKSGASSPV